MAEGGCIRRHNILRVRRIRGVPYGLSLIDYSDFTFWNLTDPTHGLVTSVLFLCLHHRLTLPSDT
jgi:hypothetical protein